MRPLLPQPSRLASGTPRIQPRHYLLRSMPLKFSKSREENIHGWPKKVAEHSSVGRSSFSASFCYPSLSFCSTHLCPLCCTPDVNEEYVLPGNVSVIRGSLNLQSNSSAATKVEFDLDGLHFVEFGSLYLMGYPRESKFATDPRGILGMVPQTLTNLTVEALNKSLETRISRLTAQLGSGVEEDSSRSEDDPELVQNCTLQIYGKLLQAGNTSYLPLLDQMEQ